MRNVHSNPKDARERGERGREYVVKNLSIDVVASKVMERLSLLWSKRKMADVGKEGGERVDEL